MMESILVSIKKLLGIKADYTYFDDDIIMHINTVFSALSQIGVGPEDGFSISDDLSLWYDYLQDNKKLNLIKTYMYLRVKLIFDPPASGIVTDSVKRTIDELEWRIYTEIDNGNEVI